MLTGPRPVDALRISSAFRIRFRVDKENGHQQNRESRVRDGGYVDECQIQHRRNKIFRLTFSEHYENSQKNRHEIPKEKENAALLKHVRENTCIKPGNANSVGFESLSEQRRIQEIRHSRTEIRVAVGDASNIGCLLCLVHVDDEVAEYGNTHYDEQPPEDDVHRFARQYVGSCSQQHDDVAGRGHRAIYRDGYHRYLQVTYLPFGDEKHNDERRAQHETAHRRFGEDACVSAVTERVIRRTLRIEQQEKPR